MDRGRDGTDSQREGQDKGRMEIRKHRESAREGERRGHRSVYAAFNLY